MPLLPSIYPRGGQVLMCEFGPEPAKVQPPGLMIGPLGVSPEMFKERPAVVINASRGMTLVVPLSTGAPKTPQKYHYCIPAGTYPFLDPNDDSWVKADMLESVSNERLDRPFTGGKRQTVSVSTADFKKIRETVLHALALGRLTEHL